MPARELDIIAEARVTLNDTAKQRWTDERLMKLLDTAQQEFCREIPFLVRNYSMQTMSNRDEYKLPSDALKVLTARAGGHTIEPISMEELDARNPEWEDDVASTYTNLVVNNMTSQTVRPYPLLSEDAAPIERVIKLRYSARPLTLSWDGSDCVEPLVIPDIWDYALTQFIISKAFIDYGDESSLSRAQVAQGLYTSMMDKARRNSKKSFSKRVVTTPFQGRVSTTNNTNGVNHGRSYR